MGDDNHGAISAFITGAPPGELADVISDIKALTVNEPALLHSALPAFQTYNEEQFTTVKLPGSSEKVLVCRFNSLGGGRYYDTGSSTSYEFDHETQTASGAQSYSLESPHKDLINSLLKSIGSHASEHYENATYSVFPKPTGDFVATVLVANKYSPSNFWNGRWRAVYHLNTETYAVFGTINVDVHYYEDGNVRLTTKKDVKIDVPNGASASEIVRQIAVTEKKYQEELNRGFSSLSEGVFKGLRRQLPVTRQKVEWERIGSYKATREVPGTKR